MKTRICRGKCGQEKDIIEFPAYKTKNGTIKYKYYCKPCDYLNVKEYRKNHPDKHKAQTDRYYEKHKDERVEYHKNYCLEHQDERKAHWEENKNELLAKQKTYYKEHPEKKREQDRKYFENNKDKIMEKKKEYIKNKYKTDPSFRLRKLVSRAIWGILKGKKEGKSWLKFVGYNLTDLMKHLEKQFDDKMNWNNYGNYWVIDHIVPIIAFNIKSFEDSNFEKCWSLKNLRPLSKTENESKNDEINEKWNNIKLFEQFLGK